MDKATETMIENLHKNTGKTLEEWVDIVRREGLEKHGQIVKFLKAEHSFTHGFANLVAHKVLKSDAGSADSHSDLIAEQYKGKEHFKPLYDKLIAITRDFGGDMDIAPKKAYVSLRRKKQFAILKPATKTRFEIELNLKGIEPQGKLEEIKTANAMCSHVIKLTVENDVDQDIVNWMSKAYDMAG